jgi:phage baseplate assembly protein V
MDISVTDAEEIARHISRLYEQIADLRNKVGGIVMHGAVTDVDPKTQRVRIEIGTEKMPQKSGWVPYGLGFGGNFSQIWHPSIGQNMTLVSPNGDKAQSVAWPFTYSDKFKAPSDDGNCNILCNFGTSRIEVWKDRIKIISDNIEEVGNKTITETAGDLISETCTKADITNTAKRYVKIETQDHDDGSAISLKTGNPNKADSVITLQAGNPGTGTSAVAIQTGTPGEGDSILIIAANPPLLGTCQLDLVSGGWMTQMVATNVTVSLGGNFQIAAGINIDLTAGAEIDMHASEIALLGHTDVGGYGGPPIARLGDNVAVDIKTGLGHITSGAGNSNAV